MCTQYTHEVIEPDDEDAADGAEDERLGHGLGQYVFKSKITIKCIFMNSLKVGMYIWIEEGGGVKIPWFNFVILLL